MQKYKTKLELLSRQQQMMKDKQLPVFVIMDGFGAAGVGTIIGKLIDDLDPRFYSVIPMKSPSDEEKRKPFLWRYAETIPEAGKFVFLTAGWMEEIVEDMITNSLSIKQESEKIESVRIFERQLKDNGYLVLKFFLSISKKEQKKRIKELLKEKNTQWRVNDNDLLQMKNHKSYEKAYHAFMEKTTAEELPWYIIDSTDKKKALEECLTILTDRIHSELIRTSHDVPITEKSFPLKPMPLLSEVTLGQEMSKEDYSKRLKILQKKLKSLHNQIYRKKIPVIIAYEGWDAAGKGGNIKRLSSSMDPRGFEVFPIASPEPHEKNRHYLWRFWNRLPKDGHIAIFDRTWYGRVMVERIEGFCSENDWKRAYTEINEFEKILTDWGAVVIKFWVQIDKDTQLARFNDRQSNPDKRWKITDEDWRNRDKWDLYDSAVNEMLQKTSTRNAPWYILASTNKYFARIQALEIVIDELETALKKK